MDDLRQWLQKADQIGELKKIEGADCNLEIGAITTANAQKSGSALLFDHIKGYPAGFRVLTCSASKPALIEITFNFPQTHSESELVKALGEKLLTAEEEREKFPPQLVENGPILENTDTGKDVDLFKFPVPLWHELDGGRYIGTGDAVITRDPETGEINLGTYRVMVQNKNTTGLYIVPAQHGRSHLEKYHALGKPAPVAVSVGHHPLIYRIAALQVPPGGEYSVIGAMARQPVEVIREEITGLPIPANSEIVIAGWCPPQKTMDEGPFGEFTGYYGGKIQAPVIEVERIYYRQEPVILGSPPGWGKTDPGYCIALVQSAKLTNELRKSGIPGIRGVWLHPVGRQMFITVSLKQMYPGHLKEAAWFICQSRIGSNSGRYVILVDDDIDPTNLDEVIWALATRSDPAEDIDIVRRARGNPLDPRVRRPAKVFYNSRAIISACKPFEWIDEFPQKLEVSEKLRQKIEERWGKFLDL